MPKVRILVDTQGYPSNAVVDLPAAIARNWKAAGFCDDTPAAVAAGGAPVAWRGGHDVELIDEPDPGELAAKAQIAALEAGLAAVTAERDTLLKAAEAKAGGKDIKP